MSGATVSWAAESLPGTKPTIRIDPADETAVRACLKDVRPDVVFVNATVPSGLEPCGEGTTDAHQAARNVIRTAVTCVREYPATIICFSTDHVFDRRSGPYGEDDVPSPTCGCGRSALEAEALVQTLPDHLILRTADVFGWDRSSDNLAMLVSRELTAGVRLRVPDDHWITPTAVEYLAEVSVRLLQGTVRGRVNVAGADVVTIADLAAAIARSMALDSRLVERTHTLNGEEPTAPSRSGLRTDRLSTILGTQPQDLAESLKRLRRHWRADTHVEHGPAGLGAEATELKANILARIEPFFQAAHGRQAFVPFQTRIPYAGRVFGSEEIVNLVDSSLDFWLTMGPYADRFEQRLKEWFGARDALFVTSGSAANLNATMTLLSPQLERPLRPGDEILTPAVTFPTTLAPIVHSGLVPVFIDCEIGTYNMDPHQLEEAVSDSTRAIMVPHTLGNPNDMDILMDVARRHELYVIEDSCDAFGSTFRGRPVGTFGDLATLSFFPAHHITVGEGGAVIVNSPGLARIARSVRDWGRDCWCAPGESNTCGKRFGWQCGELPEGYDHKFIYSNVGYNLKPTDMQAAIGVAQMDRLPQFIERRKHNFRVLYDGLAQFDDALILPTLDPRSDPAWFGFPITVHGGFERRDLVQWLEAANIETRGIFGGNILRQPGYANIRSRVFRTLHESDRVMRDTFFIGVYPGLDDEMLEFVLSRFEAFFASNPRGSAATVAAK
jgi:CDP-6-deoxy-D-xylo-4-hexulose-3-dehydrase